MVNVNEEKIEKFLADKNNEFSLTFEEVYSTIEDTINIGGVCLYSYFDLMNELPNDKINCFNMFIKFLSDIYTINFIDMSGVTALHESEEEYIISDECGLTLQFISKDR